MTNSAIPQFEGSLQGYSVNFLKKNFWRLENFMEYEDALQETVVVYLKVAKKYPVIDTDKHFMALYKTALANHFNDLSVKDTKLSNELSFDSLGFEKEDTGTDFLDTITGDTDNNGFINTMIRQAPEEVRQVLSLFANAPTEILELASQAWRDSGKNKDYGNSMLCRLLGIKPGTDVVSAVESYFAE